MTPALRIQRLSGSQIVDYLSDLARLRIEVFREFPYLYEGSAAYNEQWGIGGGDAIKVFSTRLGRIGVNICYDSEFPLIARAQVEAGAQLILAPSCTDGLAGYYRVRIGCQARALENQCYVVQSPTVGRAEWSEAVDINVGAAAIYTPVDYGFPSDGVLAIGKLDARQWVYGLLEPQRLRTVRETGQVFNYRDWPRQLRIAAGGVENVAL